MARQLLRVQAAYGCNVMVIAIIYIYLIRPVSQYRISACDTCNFSSWENAAFLLVETTVCSRFYYWSEVQVTQKSIIVQSAYTSTIEWSLLKWTGRDCDSSMHDTIGVYCCHVTMFWNLIGIANFLAVEVTVWTSGSCQAISPTAWEQG